LPKPLLRESIFHPAGTPDERHEADGAEMFLFELGFGPTRQLDRFLCFVRRPEGDDQPSAMFELPLANRTDD